jgi:uncharacterized protein (TIGR03083 family)
MSAISLGRYGELMPLLSYDRYCDEILRQTSLLAAMVKDADLTAAVPSCPGWTAGRLLRHVGDLQRWAGTTVGSRAAEPQPVEHSPDLLPGAAEDPVVLSAWLADGAAALAGALRAAGPGTPVWTPVPGGTTDFYARRFTHETAIHRADAALAAGAEYELGRDVALDGIDEWMELGSSPAQSETDPRRRELLGAGRTLHFHATDTPPEAAAEWLVDLTGEAIAWRRVHERAAVAIRGPLTGLLLVIYKRRPARGGGIEVFGDAALLDFWLERVSFG